MKRMVLIFSFLLGIGLLGLAQQVPRIIHDSEWKNAAQLPDVDMAGLSADQKQNLLKLLREESCTCGCSFKMAECRVKDPKCAFSRMSAHAAVKAIKEGKTPDEMRKAALAENHLKTLDETVKIKIEGSPSKGPANARITLVEYSDFQCPYCSKAVLQLEQVLKQHPNELRLVFKQYPIAMIHSQATLAAQASLAAHAQGKFWLMHDVMFANGTKLTRANILTWAKQMNMDMPRFTQDLDSPQIKKAIDADVAEADEIGVLGTPTVFVNGQRYNGELDPSAFGAVIDAQLKK